MIAYTIHAYTTDSTEGIIVDRLGTHTEEQLITAWLNCAAGKELLSFCDKKDIFLCERPILETYELPL